MDVSVHYQEAFWLMSPFIVALLITLRIIHKEIDKYSEYGQQEENNRPYDWERDGM